MDINLYRHFLFFHFLVRAGKSAFSLEARPGDTLKLSKRRFLKSPFSGFPVSGTLLADLAAVLSKPTPENLWPFGWQSSLL